MIERFTPPQGWATAAGEVFGIDLWRIPFVIVSAVIIYVAFLVLVRIFGIRILGTMSSFDAVVIIMFGAVAGRVILGHPPTVMVGVIGLATLMVMEAIFGAVQHTFGFRRAVSARPRIVMAHGKMIPHAMRRTHITEANLYVAIREAGIASPELVQCVILEATGRLSVIKEGTPIDPRLLENVEGRELVMQDPGPSGLTQQ